MLLSGPRSYYDEYLRKKGSNDRSLHDPNSLLTDRGAYVNFLEVQLERVSAACLSVQSYEERFNDFQSMIKTLEQRSMVNTKLIGLSQQCAEEIRSEMEKKIDALVRQREEDKHTFENSIQRLTYQVSNIERSLNIITLLESRISALENDNINHADRLQAKDEEVRTISNTITRTLEDIDRKNTHNTTTFDDIRYQIELVNAELVDQKAKVSNYYHKLESRMNEELQTQRREISLELVRSEHQLADKIQTTADEIVSNTMNTVQRHYTSVIEEVEGVRKSFDEQMDQINISMENTMNSKLKFFQQTVDSKFEDISFAIARSPSQPQSPIDFLPAHSTTPNGSQEHSIGEFTQIKERDSPQGDLSPYPTQLQPQQGKHFQKSDANDLLSLSPEQSSQAARKLLEVQDFQTEVEKAFRRESKTMEDRVQQQLEAFAMNQSKQIQELLNKQYEQERENQLFLQQQSRMLFDQMQAGLMMSKSKDVQGDAISGYERESSRPAGPSSSSSSSLPQHYEAPLKQFIQSRNERLSHVRSEVQVSKSVSDKRISRNRNAPIDCDDIDDEEDDDDEDDDPHQERENEFSQKSLAENEYQRSASVQFSQRSAAAVAAVAAVAAIGDQKRQPSSKPKRKDGYKEKETESPNDISGGKGKSAQQTQARNRDNSSSDALSKPQQQHSSHDNIVIQEDTEITYSHSNNSASVSDAPVNTQTKLITHMLHEFMRQYSQDQQAIGKRLDELSSSTSSKLVSEASNTKSKSNPRLVKAFEQDGADENSSYDSLNEIMVVSEAVAGRQSNPRMKSEKSRNRNSHQSEAMISVESERRSQDTKHLRRTLYSQNVQTSSSRERKAHDNEDDSPSHGSNHNSNRNRMNSSDSDSCASDGSDSDGRDSADGDSCSSGEDGEPRYDKRSIKAQNSSSERRCRDTHSRPITIETVASGRDNNKSQAAKLRGVEPIRRKHALPAKSKETSDKVKGDDARLLSNQPASSLSISKKKERKVIKASSSIAPDPYDYLSRYMPYSASWTSMVSGGKMPWRHNNTFVQRDRNSLSPQRISAPILQTINSHPSLRYENIRESNEGLTDFPSNVTVCGDSTTLSTDSINY